MLFRSVENIILSTTIGIKPTNLLEELMSDADFDYFGRDDFFEIAENLRLELNIYGGAISAHTWDKLQIEFIEQHHYYTKSAQKKRLPKKLDNLNSIKKRLISY